MVLPVILADLVAEEGDPRRAPAEPLHRPDDADVVPHEAAELVPVVRDDDALVRRRARRRDASRGRGRRPRRVAELVRSRRARRGGRRRAPRGASSTRAGSRRAGRCTRPRRSPRGRGIVVRPIEIGDDAAAHGSAPPARRGSAARPCRCRTPAGRVDVREVLEQEALRQVRDVEEHAVVAAALHLQVDRARHDVARRELLPRIVRVMNGSPVGVAAGCRPRRGAPR